MIVPVISFGVAFVAIFAADKKPERAVKADEIRVGEILIFGNTKTIDSVILEASGFYPGQILRKADLRRAKKRLEKLAIFESVRVEKAPIEANESWKSILIKIEEKPTGRIRLMPGFDSKSGFVISVVLEERNFDPLRFPRSIDDITDGRAFRGAAMNFRLELLQISMLPSPTSIKLPFKIRRDSADLLKLGESFFKSKEK
jgi:outer membrane protein assembly factor BamA